jgi:SET domain
MSELQPTQWIRRECMAWFRSPLGEVRECHNLTRRGYLCADHLRERKGLEIKLSHLTLAGEEAGLGLFTTVARQRHELIDEYRGEIQTRAEFDAAPSVYAVAISQGRVINAIRSDSCAARFANDLRSEDQNNSELISDRQWGMRYAQPRYRNGSGAKVYLITTKRVAAGEEIFCSYGETFYR